MPERVRITDVAPRDGLQNEPGVIPTMDKVRLIELLSATGVDEVELTSFVSPKWVPQLADAREVVAAIGEFAEGVRAVTGVIPRPETREQVGTLPEYSVLVPNEKGFKGVLEAHERHFPLKVALFTSASETFSKKNTNATIEQTIERFRPIVPQVVENRLPLRLYVSCAIACPYEGKIEPWATAGVVQQFQQLLPPEIADDLDVDVDLADTIGVAHPEEVAGLLEEFKKWFGERALRRVTLHLHDTFGRAASCVKTAMEMGVRSFDGSVAGLGGCPFASTPGTRAPGNISTETLVRTVLDAGYHCDVDLDLLADAARFAREIVERARAEAAAGEDEEP